MIFGRSRGSRDDRLIIMDKLKVMDPEEERKKEDDSDVSDEEPGDDLPCKLFIDEEEKRIRSTVV